MNDEEQHNDEQEEGNAEMVGERKQTVDVEFIETPHCITIFWRDLANPRQRGGRLADAGLQSGTTSQTLASPQGFIDIVETCQKILK